MSIELKYLRWLIAFAFRLGQLNEKKTILTYLSLVSAQLNEEEPETMKTRFTLQQIGKRVWPSLMSEHQGIFGEAKNSVDETIQHIIDYHENSFEVNATFVQEMETNETILRTYLESVVDNTELMLGE